jgi:hypothetical protein
MGWWQIEPATGKPKEDARSALSEPPDFVLLNAVPGIDGDEAACYLGDGPWDMASTLPDEILAAVGPVAWSEEQVRDLFLTKSAPPDLGFSARQIEQLHQIVDNFWKDIDFCYEDDWERPARASERHWIGEDVVRRLTNPSGGHSPSE